MQAFWNHARALGLGFEYSIPADSKTAILLTLEAQVQAYMSAQGIVVPHTEAVALLPIRRGVQSPLLFKVYWAKARGKNNHPALLHHWSADDITYGQLEEMSKRIADPDGYDYVIVGEMITYHGNRMNSFLDSTMRRLL